MVQESRREDPQQEGKERSVRGAAYEGGDRVDEQDGSRAGEVEFVQDEEGDGSGEDPVSLLDVGLCSRLVEKGKGDGKGERNEPCLNLQYHSKDTRAHELELQVPPCFGLLCSLTATADADHPHENDNKSNEP